MSTLCKSGHCWGHHHDLCKGDWVSDEGTLFRCTCGCHGAHRLTLVAAGADLGHDETADDGDGGMGSGDWMQQEREYDPAYPEEEAME